MKDPAQAPRGDSTRGRSSCAADLISPAEHVVCSRCHAVCSVYLVAAD